MTVVWMAGLKDASMVVMSGEKRDDQMVELLGALSVELLAGNSDA